MQGVAEELRQPLRLALVADTTADPDTALRARPVKPQGRGGGPAQADTDEGFSIASAFGDETGSVSKRPSESRPKGREDEEDLDQFQSWLQGLKG